MREACASHKRRNRVIVSAVVVLALANHISNASRNAQRPAKIFIDAFGVAQASRLRISRSQAGGMCYSCDQMPLDSIIVGDQLELMFGKKKQ